MIIEAKTIFTMGDPHGDIGRVNEFINKHHPDVLIINGDFALHWWTRHQTGWGGITESWYLDDSDFNRLKPQSTKIFWLMGNHQAWNFIEDTYGRNGQEPIEMKPNLYYCPIGSTLKINGKNCLFVGGAASTDKEYRVTGFEWFEQEELDDSDDMFIKLSCENKKINMLFSHTCATGYDILAPHDIGRLKFNDNTCNILKNVVDLCNPEYHFFGHFHLTKGGRYKDTYWQCVNTISSGFELEGRSSLNISGLFNL